MASHTSYWLSFFRDAGLPDTICTKYAVLFSNERIDPSMLPEISKDILKDVGITAMGDIISILRHARATVEKDTQNKTLEGMVRATPAGRTIAHYVGANSTRKEIVKLGGSKTQAASSPEVKPTPVLRRRVTPEIEGSYKIILPKGTTPKTRAILKAMEESKKAKNESMVADKEAANRSVFDRLATNAAQPSLAERKTVYIRRKVPATLNEKSVRQKEAESESVFRRLGPRQTESQSESLHSDKEITEYAGVLKLTAGTKRRIGEKNTSGSAASPEKRSRIGGSSVSTSGGVVRAEATSTTHSEGIFANSLRKNTASSVRERLGIKTSSISGGRNPGQGLSLRTSALASRERPVGVKARLGVKPADSTADRW